MRGGGVSWFSLLATAAASPPPAHLARNRELGGWFSILFTRDTRHVTTQPLPGLRCLPRHHPPPLSLANASWVVLCSFRSPHPPRHHHHPISLAIASWGWFFVRFTRHTRHVTTTTPSRSQSRVGGGSLFVSLAAPTTSPPPPLSVAYARWGWLLILFAHDNCHHPFSPANARWGWFIVLLTSRQRPPPPLARIHEWG